VAMRTFKYNIIRHNRSMTKPPPVASAAKPPKQGRCRHNEVRLGCIWMIPGFFGPRNGRRIYRAFFVGAAGADPPTSEHYGGQAIWIPSPLSCVARRAKRD
jgi:hypothetical protein